MVPLKEAVQRLPMSRRTVDRAIAEGRIKVKHFGTRVYVPVSEIARIERDGLPR
jgi:predicted site-specific integrase-resolvase